MPPEMLSVCFFFSGPPPTEIYTLSLHDALPILQKAQASGPAEAAELAAAECVVLAETKDHANWELIGLVAASAPGETRSEEHTSELQSRRDLVCRLLLEKKKKKSHYYTSFSRS